MRNPITLHACICLVIFSLSLSNTHLVKAQSDTTQYKRLTSFPILSINNFMYAKSDYETPTGNGNIKMTEYNTSLQLAFKLKENKLYLFNKIHYGHFNFSSEFNGKNIDEHFNSLAISAGLIVVLKNRWKLFGIVTPTLASDFEKPVSSDDLLTQASVIATKRTNPFCEYGFGLALTTRFGRELLIPLATLTYKKNNWTTLMILPAYLSQYYEINDTKIGIKMATFGNLYNLSNPPSMKVEMDKLGYSRITIGPDFSTKLLGSFYLNFNAGLAVRNRLESINNNQQVEMELSTKEKFFFNVGISLQK